MALPRGFCAQTFLFAALTAGTCFARIFLDGDGAALSKLRIQTEKQAAPNSYGTVVPPPCTPGTPQFPNYIQPMKIDPTRMMGKWFFYEAWFDGILDTRVTVNIVISIENLLNGSLTLYPGSNTQAVALSQHFGTFRSVTNQCGTAAQSFLDYLTVDGDLRGFGFSNGSTAVHTAQVLSTDYESYVLFFDCGKYGVNSGICLDAYPHVYTRERQDKVSPATANKIVGAINQAFGPYCFTADLMRKYPWINDMAECPLFVPSDACYVAMRNAYLYQGDPNFDG